MRLIIAFSVLIPCAGAVAQEAATDDLFFNSERVGWSSPETLVRDLRSPNEQTRVKALRLFGLTDPQIRLFNSAAGEGVQIDLRYAPLGEDATPQAIVALAKDTYTFAAVALPKAAGWERVGVASCWCKYEANPLRDFLELRPAAPPGDKRFELVLRTSGGGTGIYSQTESHFRVHAGILQRVISFESMRQSCPAAPIRPCSVTKRWLSGELLVEGRATFDSYAVPEIAFRLRELEDRYFTSVTCTPYEWDPSSFRYRKTGPAASCPSIKR